jgi:hypothetical protein
VKPDEAVVVVVPLAGAAWVMVTGVTVRVKVQLPVSWEASESVPETVQLPAGRVPEVVMTPEEETRTPQAFDVLTKVTAPLWPLVTSWLVKPEEAVVVVVAPAGASWVMVPGGMVPGVIVSVNVQLPVSREASESVPDTPQLPAARVPLVVIAPVDETTTPQAVEVVTKVAGPIWPAVTR